MNIMLKDLRPATSDNYRALERQYGASNYKPFDVVLTRGLGVWVWDINGRRYLDCLSAYSAVNQGHCHPRILAAMTEQASRLAITSRAFMNDQLPLFCKELCAATQSHKVLPMNSGAFGPFTPGFSRVIPFGDPTALEAVITPNTVAFLVEPIQGEAGVIIPPPGYFKSVREICKRHNVILILDEIQTGLGRTGRLLAEEHEGIEADLTLIGKALSGGFYPVSAVLSNDEILGVLKPGEHGSTFGGNPLACAVARAALKVLIEEGMVENAYAMGARFLAGLRQINSPAVKEVRGRGLMIAIELHSQAGGARRYCDALRQRGVLCKDTHDHTIRVSPPLVITSDEIDWALAQFDATLRHPQAA
jgi:ornithine--oxo-acid transaminase